MAKLKKGWKEVKIDLDNDILLKLSMEAHNRDITLNALVNIYLKDFIKKIKNMSTDEVKKLLNMDKINEHKTRQERANLKSKELK